MSTASLRSALVPAGLTGGVCLDGFSIPRFWASIWMDVLKGHLEASTRQRHLSAVSRLYEATERQRGTDCLDRLLANLNFDAIEEVLVGFLAQLRNESAVDGADRSSTWDTAVTFVMDIVRHGSSIAEIRAGAIETRLRRLEQLYSQVTPSAVRSPPPIRALPPPVINDLCSIFDPESSRNPFKTEAQRWRNLLIFMLLLRLGLRRGEVALLAVNAIKDEPDPSGRTVTWINVEAVRDEDPRYEIPGMKTALSRRQIPIPQEIVLLTDAYIRNYRGRTHHPQLLMSQKRRPLSLRTINEIFENATTALSEPARRCLEKQGISGISCHDLRHTCAVVRIRRYQDAGDHLDRAMEKLRLFFGWTPESEMPRLYARAYFETELAEVWNESFDHFIDALRRCGYHRHE